MKIRDVEAAAVEARRQKALQGWATRRLQASQGETLAEAVAPVLTQARAEAKASNGTLRAAIKKTKKMAEKSAKRTAVKSGARPAAKRAYSQHEKIDLINMIERQIFDTAGEFAEEATRETHNFRLRVQEAFFWLREHVRLHG